MVSAKTQKWIQKSIDGRLSSRNRRKLGRILQEDEEAAELARALEDTVAMLKEIPREDPPAGMKESILREVYAIDRETQPSRHKISSFTKAFNRPLPRMAGAFALGVLITGLFFVFLYRVAGDADPFSRPFLNGTMGVEETRGREAWQRYRFSRDGTEGELFVFLEGSGVRLHLRMENQKLETPLEMKLNYSETDLSFLGMNLFDPVPVEMVSDPGQFRISIPGGEGFDVALRRQTQKTIRFHIDILQDAEVAFSEKVILPERK